MLIICGLLSLCVCAGLLVVRLLHARKEKQLVRSRLEQILLSNPVAEVNVVNDEEEPDWLAEARTSSAFVQNLERKIQLSDTGMKVPTLAVMSLSLLAVPCAVALIFDLPIFIALLAGLILAAIPYIVIHIKAEQKRNKFVDQLPDAIDLMISILRSGLSIPQAVKAVGEEIPAPCGAEFQEALHRMNLGQTLPEALFYTVERYRVFELDLIRRAVSIQTEIGGSLADLLEKTNSTLRQRLKLKRTVNVLTSQSRLAGKIICAMPFVIAVAFQIMNPGYLRPLYETNVGKVMVVLALCFQLAGIFTIRKLSTFKV